MQDLFCQISAIIQNVSFLINFENLKCIIFDLKDSKRMLWQKFTNGYLPAYNWTIKTETQNHDVQNFKLRLFKLE